MIKLGALTVREQLEEVVSQASKRVMWLTALAILTSGSIPAGVDEPLTRAQADELLIELRAVRGLLEKQCGLQAKAQREPSIVTVNVSNSPSMGAKDAPLAIVEFTDYQCPFCQRFFQQTFQDLKKDYIAPGKLRFVVMDFPLERHQNALLAAQAAQCANEQGAFWALHDQMQANPEHLTVYDLAGYARESGINVAAFHECLDSGRYKQTIQQAVRAAAEKGVRGTPTFVIGKNTPAGVEGELSVGVASFGAFEQKLKALVQ
jgi:protein-disulfide isomerase